MNWLDQQRQFPIKAGAYAAESPSGTNELKISHQAFPEAETRLQGFFLEMFGRFEFRAYRTRAISRIRTRGGQKQRMPFIKSGECFEMWLPAWAVRCGEHALGSPFLAIRFVDRHRTARISSIATRSGLLRSWPTTLANTMGRSESQFRNPYTKAPRNIL